jgi:hypothetical protein
MLKDTFFDFRKKCELLISVGGGHIYYKRGSFVPHNKWHSFFFKMVYHLWNGDSWLFFYKRLKNGNI